MSGSDVFIYIFSVIIIIVYFLAFYVVILKKDVQRRMVRRFHNAVCNIYEIGIAQNYSMEELFDQIILNYEKLCQNNPNNNYTSALDLLNTLIYYYDSCPESIFKNIFRMNKNPEIRRFIFSMSSYTKDKNPFISIPKKEADLLYSIQYALISHNESLATTSILHLSQEIENKEKLCIKQDKENQRANILSIVGVILTIFFGVLSFIKFK